MNMEIRFQELELVSNSDNSLTVSGYVNKTDQQSNVLGTGKKFVEKIANGAFQRAIDRSSINSKDIDFLAEHKKNLILSSTRNGSLKLHEDEIGLYMEAVITPTSWGKDYYELINSRIIQNMSFGFRAIKDKWTTLEPGLFERVIEELELFEVSAVKNPAYSQSTIAARGIDVVEEVEIPDEVQEESRTMEKVDEILGKLTSLEERFTLVLDELKEIRSEKEEEVEVNQEAKPDEQVEEKPAETDEEETKVEDAVEDEEEEEELKEETEKVELEEKTETLEESKEEIKDEKEEKSDEEDEVKDEEKEEEQEEERSETPNFSEFRNKLSSLK